MPRPSGNDEINRFLESLDESAGRLCRASDLLAAFKCEVEKYPDGPVREHVRSCLAVTMRRLERADLAPHNTMKPWATLLILFGALVITAAIIALTIVVFRYTQDFKEALAITCAVVFIVTLLVVHLAMPNLSASQQRALDVVLALAAAGVGAGIPGFLNIEGKWQAFTLSAGGALALFVIVLTWKPVRRGREPQS
jgi:hypothetical protein